VSNLKQCYPPTCGDVVALPIWLHDAMDDGADLYRRQSTFVRFQAYFVLWVDA